MSTAAPQPPIAVLGGGSWGTALAMLLASTGRAVQLWSWSAEDSAAMAAERENQRYLPGLRFPDTLSIDPDASYVELVRDFDVFLLVVPSHAFRETLSALHAALIEAGKTPDSVFIMWGTKGFDPRTGDLLSVVVDEVFGPNVRRLVISGPSFAGETARGLPTALTAGSNDLALAEQAAEWFRTPSTRVYPNTDIIGVQLGGAIKNVMAVAAGISDGLGYGANARAALITRGLAELTRLGLALGGKLETFMGLAGMGDLILTCTDDQSRNRRLGLGVGKGQSAQATMAEIGQEVEGYNTSRELYLKAKDLNIEMPITDEVYHVLYQGRDPREAVRTLLGRNPVAEGSH